MSFLVKLVLLPVWLPLKLIWEAIEHSGRNRHRSSRRTRAVQTSGHPAVVLLWVVLVIVLLVIAFVH